MKEDKQAKFLNAFVLREVFSAIGFTFILIFTARGINQMIFIFTNYIGDVGALLSGNSSKEQWSIILDALKHYRSPTLDIILLVLCGFIIIHGVIGVFYAISTDYNVKSMFKDKVWLYLQIVSAFAAVFIVMAFIMPSGNVAQHSAGIWFVIALISVLGSFHIANGFVNACITLGISVSKQTKIAVRVLSWIIAVISVLQLFILLI